MNVDGRRIICESDDSAKDMFSLRVDDRLRAAMRGDKVTSSQTDIDVEVQNVLRPKEIQARIRAGASVEQLADAAGVPVERVERFAHPVLLERARAAELATAAHPVLADGPSVLTLLETVTPAAGGRGPRPRLDRLGRLAQRGRPVDRAAGLEGGPVGQRRTLPVHPGAHGGTVSASDDAARQLINPDFGRPLRPVAAVPHPVRQPRDPRGRGHAGRGARAVLPTGRADSRACSPGTQARPQGPSRGSGLGGRPAGRAIVGDPALIA